jgi:hypothetical protein
MEYLGDFLIGFGAMLAIMGAFAALDPWHMRRSWRNANRHAEETLGRKR